VLIPVVVYLLLGCLAFWPIAPWDTHTLPVCNCADYAKMAAFLEWTPWAILHGHNPFFTTYQNYPVGVNMALNTTMPFLGVVLAPISLTAGPIAAMNVLARVALAGSAITAFLVFRRWVRWTPAAAAGGLLFGFSPYVFAHAIGHPNLIFVVLLPVLLLLVDEVVVRQEMRARRAGLLLGVVAAAQYGISSELLADAAMLTVAALVLLALLHRSAVRRHAGHVARATAWMLLSFVPLAGYPIAEALFGPQHLTGPVQPLYALDPLRSDLLGALMPTRTQYFSLGHVGAVASGFVHHNIAENATYVGIPMLLLLLVGTIAYRRDSRLMLSSLMVAVAYVVSLGLVLDVDGRDTGIPLPFRLLLHIPVLDGAIAVRFFAFGYLFLALGFALTLDHLRGSAPAPAAGDVPPHPSEAPEPSEPRVPAGGDGRPWRRAPLRPLLTGLVGVVALVPLLPRLTLPSSPTSLSQPGGSYAVPAYFTDGGEQAIPAGSPVLVYPYTTGFFNYQVLWQAAGGMRFRIAGANATVPGPGGVGVGGDVLQPAFLEVLLRRAYAGPDPAPLLDRLDASDMRQVRGALTRYGFSTVIAAPVGRFPGEIVSYLTTVLGRPPTLSGGVYVWYGVQQDLRHERASGQGDGAGA
jgi:hypothetical protein